MSKSKVDWAGLTEENALSSLPAGNKLSLSGSVQSPSKANDQVKSSLQPSEAVKSPTKDKGPSFPEQPPDQPDMDAETEKELAQTTDQLAQVNVQSTSADEEEPLPINMGLHPNDETAEVSVVDHSQPAQNSIYKAAKTFEELGLSQSLLNAVYELKFSAPSKIQAQAIPIVLSSKRPNLIGQAHHGSGKTATFSLCILSIVDPNFHSPQAVVVVPTRELALQVTEVIRKLAKFTPIEILCAVPRHAGESFDKGPVTQHIVVGTPGSLENRLKHRNLNPATVKVFVADEADQMVAQEAFGEITMKIKRKFNPRTTQVLLFSATFDQHVKEFARKIAENAVEIIVKTEELSLDSIKQFYIECANVEEKYTTLTSLYGLCEIGQSIIFVHTVATAKELTNRMRRDGYTVSLLHGRDMSPEQRDLVMADFKSGKTTVLITTNVIARGIDVLSVTLVINFDIPLDKYNRPDPETYIHRIGRSGRFGRKGVAINFVYDEKSKSDLLYISKHFNKDIEGLPKGDLEKITERVQQALK